MFLSNCASHAETILWFCRKYSSPEWNEANCRLSHYPGNHDNRLFLSDCSALQKGIRFFSSPHLATSERHFYMDAATIQPRVSFSPPCVFMWRMFEWKLHKLHFFMIKMCISIFFVVSVVAVTFFWIKIVSNLLMFRVFPRAVAKTWKVFLHLKFHYECCKLTIDRNSLLESCLLFQQLVAA